MILFHVPLLTEKFRVDREESTPHRHMFGMWRFLIKLVTVHVRMFMFLSWVQEGGAQREPIKQVGILRATWQRRR